MNKNIIIIAGVILLVIIAYQAYLLNSIKSSNNKEINSSKHTPTIKDENLSIKKIEDRDKPTITIQSSTPLKESNITAQKDISNLSIDEMFDEELIKEDLNRLFKNIFQNPKLQEGIKEGFEQMQKELQSGLEQMQKGFGELTEEIDKLSENDPYFKEFIKKITPKDYLNFIDRDDYYYVEIPIVDGDKSKIDIKASGDILTVTVTKDIKKEQKNQNTTIYIESLSESKKSLKIPSDALIEKIESNYQDGLLKITIPKIGKKTTL